MSTQRSLTVVQMNDSHAYLEPHPEIFWQGNRAVYREAGGYARIASLLKDLRSRRHTPLLFCDCGDTLHGTFPAVQTRGRAVIPALNALEPAAMTAHWEFAYTPEVFLQQTSLLHFPMLALNIYRKENHQRVFPAHHVVDSGGLRIGLAGIASNIIDKTMPPSFSGGLMFTSGRDELPEVIHTLRTVEKVDLVVLISHLGFPQDMHLMKEITGVDVCLSAHTHHRLERPAVQGKTLVIQSGSLGSFVGILELHIEDGSITHYRHQLNEVTTTLPLDPEVHQLVSREIEPFRSELAEVVGSTAIPLSRSLVLESSMDNLILDALLEKTGAQMAFSNGWRYGAPVVPGPITRNDLYNMVPVNPPVSTTTLTGSQIIEMLEENLEHTFSRNPWKQMGGYLKRGLGFHAYVKIENPCGQRIMQLFVGDQPVQPDREYTAAFITAQGVPEKFGHNRQQHPEKMVPVLEEYLKRHSPYRSELRGTFTPI